VLVSSHPAFGSLALGPPARRASGLPRRLAIRTGLGLGVLVAPGLALAAVARYGVNVPAWDEWELALKFAKLAAGQLSLADLLAQHNEHRVFFPRLALLGLGRLTHWNLLYELYLNLAVAGLTFLLLWRLLALTLRDLHPALPLALAVPISLLTFSLAQWENWASGFQLAFFLNALGAVLATWGLARWPAHWGGLAVASAAAVLAALSLASGLAMLAIVALGVLLVGDSARARRFAAAITWAALVGWLYFRGYAKPGHHPDLVYAAAHPAQFVHYLLVYLGGAVGFWRVEAATAFGALGVLTLLAATVWLLVGREVPRTALVPWLLLAGYAMLTAAMTGLSRVGFGVEQALSSRYTTIAGLFWVSTVVVGAVAATRAFGRLRSRGRVAAGLVCLTAILATLLAAGYARSSVLAHARFQAWHTSLASAEECVRYYREAPDSCLRQIFPVAEYPRAAAALLQTLELGPFAPANRLAPLSSYEIRPPAEGRPVGRLEVVRGARQDDAVIPRGGQVLVAGWAVDPTRRRPAEAVLVVIDGEVVGKARVGHRRRDIARSLDDPAWLRSGWTYSLGAFRLPPGNHWVEAYAVLADGRGIVTLPGARPVHVTP
jgi:hypothetical protein